MNFETEKNIKSHVYSNYDCTATYREQFKFQFIFQKYKTMK